MWSHWSPPNVQFHLLISYFLKIKQRERPSFVPLMRYNVTANWKKLSNKLMTNDVLAVIYDVLPQHTDCRSPILQAPLWNSTCSLWTAGLHGSTLFQVTETWPGTHVRPASNHIQELRSVCRCVYLDGSKRNHQLWRPVLRTAAATWDLLFKGTLWSFWPLVAL